MAVKVAKFEIKRVCDNDTQWSDFVKFDIVFATVSEHEISNKM